MRRLPLGLSILASLAIPACLATGTSSQGTTTASTPGSGNQGAGLPSHGQGGAISKLDSRLQALIAAQGLTGDPSTGRSLPSIQDPIAQLGRELFFTKGLGGDQDTACATCHHPVMGAGDNLSVGVGVDAEDEDLLGPGRVHEAGSPNWDGGPTIPRNAPTTFNVALWDKYLFWNGRVESLGKTAGMNGNDGQGITTPDYPWPTVDPNAFSNLVHAQARFPVTSMDEMKGFFFEFGNFPQATREHLAARIGDYGIGQGELPYSDWADLFRTAFNQPGALPEDVVTEQNIAIALSEYQRSQTFVATPWRDYVQGDLNAISTDAKLGALLFFRDRASGGADCASCHAGDFFTDEEHYVLAMPQVGRGQSVNIGATQDVGRFLVDGKPEHLYAFRTPTLLNVAVTGPWSHAGAYTTLEGVVRHHLNPAQALQNYDFGQLAPDVQTADTVANTSLALQQLYWVRNNGFTTVEDIALSSEQVQQLVAFLHTLTDPCVEDRQCLDAWIPDPASPDPDGRRLVGHDQFGNPF
ncbi:MAG: cytochrome-c peroxidase [Planctomycetes bacterium]|nr:cytochrome-c peroxidase [Planctomycetota bacterium]